MNIRLNNEDSTIYEFDGHRLDGAKRLVYRADGSALPLKPKAFDTLLFLVKNPGRVIERDEIMEAVWPETVVEENNLTQHISSLRRLLGEGKNDHRFIVTVPGRGYEFIADVSNGEKRNEYSDLGHSSESRPSPRNWLMGIAAGAAVVILLSGFLYTREESSGADRRVKSIAVLPFKPISAEDRNPSFEMGMTSELITTLAAAEGLSVRSFEAVKRFASGDQDAVAVGRELEVDAVLDGTIQISSDRVRVFVRLTSIADAKLVWAETIDQERKHPFDLQQEISRQVARELKVRLTENSRKRYTDNPEAYQHYLKGQFHIQRLTRADVELGVRAFREAIAIDPNYALAYSGIARGYMSFVLSSEIRPHEMIELSLAAAEKAVQIDPHLPEAQATLGAVYFWFKHDWAASESALSTALDLDPSLTFAHVYYAVLMGNTGRIDKALAASKRARELDSYSAYSVSMQGTTLVHAGKPTEALERYTEASRINPRLWTPHCKAAVALIDLHRYDDAVASSRKAAKLNPSQTNSLAYESYALAKLGQRDEAQKILAGLLTRANDGYVPPYHIAIAYIGLDDRENALTWLEKAYAEKDPKMVFLRSDRFWNDVRSEPRFIRLMKEMHLD